MKRRAFLCLPLAAAAPMWPAPSATGRAAGLAAMAAGLMTVNEARALEATTIAHLRGDTFSAKEVRDLIANINREHMRVLP